MQKAKKSLGQNFLRDPKILKKITAFARIEPSDTVVEVGPGEGGLTKFLLERATKVIAIEKDSNLVELLNQKFKKEIAQGKFELIAGDILKLEPATSVSYKLVGNIPYYITGAIFKKFLENPPAGGKPTSITFVIQKEVAERILARDGKESVLSISIKAFGEPQYGGAIKAGSFNPAPKVDSAIISIRNISDKKLKGVEVQEFFRVVKRGFAHKRKLVARNLNINQEVLEKHGIPRKARAENLSLDNWILLAKSLI